MVINNITDYFIFPSRPNKLQLQLLLKRVIDYSNQLLNSPITLQILATRVGYSSAMTLITDNCPAKTDKRLQFA